MPAGAVDGTGLAGAGAVEALVRLSLAGVATASGRMTFMNGRNLAGRRRRLWLAAVLAVLLAVTACGGGGGGGGSGKPSPAAGAGGMQNEAAMANPDLDPGTSLSGPAPDFRLVNQFGQQVSLRQFRGKVVILAFTDSECTTICPLTTASMAEAKQLLGAAGEQVQLLGIDANTQATTVSDVMNYSRSHSMVNQWQFLTGSPAQLRATWKAYHIYVQIEAGTIDHTPALYVIDQRGNQRKLYLTTMAYASVGQAAQILAEQAASLLPGHPSLISQRSLAHISGLAPSARAKLSAVPTGSVTVGPGRPRLLAFFATWLTSTSDLRAQLIGLNGYARAARQERLPQLIAVDEAATEPTPGAARSYLRQLGRPLGYQVALDVNGRLADGYGVQDQPWYVLTSASGKILWKHDGWLPVSALLAAARKA
jgi:cytochrome oxidase Cu insertion factor (SCO1/SenC/PrrC family)